MIKKLIDYWQSMEMYVIADPNDNSITLSKALYQDMHKRVSGNTTARVFMFRIPKNKTYGFTVDTAALESIEKNAPLCDIQYNSKHKCIGFETLDPSVNRIFYEYGLPYNRAVKLSVRKGKAGGASSVNFNYYQLNKPSDEIIRKFAKD